jgi:hypothetical protein
VPARKNEAKSDQEVLELQSKEKMCVKQLTFKVSNLPKVRKNLLQVTSSFPHGMVLMTG